MIFGVYTISDISTLLRVISWAFRRVKFEIILKYHEWYLCQISRTNHAIICFYYWYFKLSWMTTALIQSNCGNFPCSSIRYRILLDVLFRCLGFLKHLLMPRLRVVPHFSSGIVERAKRDRAWKSPHARKGDTRRGEREMRDYRQSPSFWSFTAEWFWSVKFVSPSKSIKSIPWDSFPHWAVFMEILMWVFALECVVPPLVITFEKAYICNSLATVLLFPLCDQARPWFRFSTRTSSVAGLAFFLVAPTRATLVIFSVLLFVLL